MFKSYQLDDLLLVDQLQVMQQLVFGASLEKNFVSPFRQDRKPGCWLTEKNGHLYYHDPKDSFRNGKGVASLWAIQNNVNLYVAIQQICLGFKPKQTKYSPTPKKKVDMTFEIRHWEEYDEEYWSEYGLTAQDLEKGSPGLFPCMYVQFWSDKLKTYIRKYSNKLEPLYVYIWKDTFKIYSPLSERRFLGTSTALDYYYYNYGQSELWISSGGKDAKVLHKHGKDSLALNGEMFNPKSLPRLVFEYPRVIVALDNDDTGILASAKMSLFLTNQGVNNKIILPTKKDWAEEAKTGLNMNNYVW